MQGLRPKLMDIFTGVPKDILIPQWVYKRWKQCYFSAMTMLFVLPRLVIYHKFYHFHIWLSCTYDILFLLATCFRIGLDLLWLENKITSKRSLKMDVLSFPELQDMCRKSKYFGRMFTHRTQCPDVVLVMKIPVYCIGVWVVAGVCTRDALSRDIHSYLSFPKVLILCLNQVTLCINHSIEESQEDGVHPPHSLLYTLVLMTKMWLLVIYSSFHLILLDQLNMNS